MPEGHSEIIAGCNACVAPGVCAVVSCVWKTHKIKIGVSFRHVVCYRAFRAHLAYWLDASGYEFEMPFRHWAETYHPIYEA